MLIAARGSREAELFKTVLSLTASGERIPEEIKAYFALVLKQAKKIVSHPETVSADIYPEAIDLALDLLKIENLSEKLKSIEQVDSLTGEQASIILEKLEYSPVC